LYNFQNVTVRKYHRDKILSRDYFAVALHDHHLGRQGTESEKLTQSWCVFYLPLFSVDN